MRTALCPVCAKRPPDPGFKPFCSRRCADIDLGRWLKGSYVVPGAEAAEEGPQDVPKPGEEPDEQG